jgi:hypothetical protein
VVHPLNDCDIWQGSDAEPTRRAMPPAAASDERVLVLVPAGSGTLDSLLDLGPSVKAPSFEGSNSNPDHARGLTGMVQTVDRQ